MSVRILTGDCRALLASLDAESVQTCVTSPPYFGLRDYGHGGQIGLEPTPDAYVAELVAVFREVRRVLRDDGTLWLNLGDSYTGSGKGGNPDPGSSKQATNAGSQSVGSLYGTGRTAREAAVTNVTRRTFDLGAKQLIGIPWRVAFALQADGWYLRSDIIWHKPNPMPESVTDRPTKAHEYLFLLSKAPTYYYDGEAIAEPSAFGPRECAPGARNIVDAAEERRTRPTKVISVGETRNRRTVWTVATQPFKGAHFATFPPALIEPCILAGSAAKACETCGTAWGRVVEKSRTFESGSGRAGNLPVGKNGASLQGGGETLDIRRGPCVSTTTTGFAPRCGCETNTGAGRSLVLDPFGGAGTTGLVADRLGRDAVLCELNPQYAEMARRRVTDDAPLFADGAA